MTALDTTEAVGKGDRTRRRLLELAVERFARDGYRRASVSHIARDAGLTPAAAYAYFAGKEALFVAAVDHDAGALLDETRAAKSGPTVLARLITAIGALAAGLDHHPLARRVLGGPEPDVIRRLLDLPSLGVLRADLRDEIRDAQATGEVRGDVDADDLALGVETVVLALLMGVVQAGPVDDARVHAVNELLRAALTA